MIKTIYPTKDTTLYETTSSVNTGIDEILDIEKIISGTGGPLNKSRPILQFDTSEISASMSLRGIHTGSDSGSLRYYLKMYISEEKDVPATYDISAHALRQSWVMGIGRKTHVPNTNEGASWTYRDGDTPSNSWTDAGGYFYSDNGTEASQSFNNVQGDLEIDITKMVDAWHNGSLTNNGILIKRSGSQETNATEYGTLSYFSRETHTIYPPRIEARFDDTPTYNNTGMTTITADHNVVIGALLAPEYIQNSEVRIEIIPEPKFPTRSQTGAVSTTTKYALPANSSYCIIDDLTGEKVIPYDTTGSLLACTGSSGHYIDVDTAGLFPERYYRLQINVPNLLYTNSVQYIDIDPLFKVVR